VGITLTKAQTVLLVDRPWTPGDCYQAEDRCHRIGQTSRVLAVWLQWDDVDRAVDQLLDEKSDRIDTVLHGRRVTLRPGMSMAEFAAIATA
jgi:SNF2 family DNA or RNA helicase